MDFPNLAIYVSIIGIIFTVIIHTAFAIGAYIDGHYMRDCKRGPFLVIPLIWALAILVGGVPIVVAYWAIHHSTLRPRPTSDSTPSN